MRMPIQSNTHQTSFTLAPIKLCIFHALALTMREYLDHMYSSTRVCMFRIMIFAVYNPCLMHIQA